MTPRRILRNNKKAFRFLFNDRPRSFSTSARRNFNNNPSVFSQSFYSDNFNNYDFPHKYFINIFSSVRVINNFTNKVKP